MPVEISVPFRLGPDNQIAVESDINAQTRQHVMSLINTEPGERTVLGDYGIPLAEMLFEDDDELVANEIATDISNALRTFEPGVVIKDVSAVHGPEGDGLAQVKVQYYRTEAPDSPVASRNVNIAVISPSGKVSEVIRS